MDISELIALATVRSGKSRGELALEMGYKNQSQLSKLSAGEKKPNASEIVYLAVQAKLDPVKTLAEIEEQSHPEFAAIWQRIKTADSVRELYLANPATVSTRTRHKVRRIRPHNPVNRKLGNAKTNAKPCSQFPLSKVPGKP